MNRILEDKCLPCTIGAEADAVDGTEMTFYAAKLFSVDHVEEARVKFASDHRGGCNFPRLLTTSKEDLKSKKSIIIIKLQNKSWHAMTSWVTKIQ